MEREKKSQNKTTSATREKQIERRKRETGEEENERAEKARHKHELGDRRYVATIPARPSRAIVGLHTDTGTRQHTPPDSFSQLHSDESAGL